MKTKVNSKKLASFAFVAITMLITTSVCLAQCDSIQYKRIENPKYFGYEIGVGIEHQTLSSSISQLKNLQVAMHGATVGVKLANTRGAVRATGGLYYSGENVPYTIDMIKGGLSGSVYLLRLKKVVYRSFEPYALMSFTYQQTKFLGTYLNDDNKNRSVSEEPELGRINWCAASIGAGVEFQLENQAYQFIHFFAEAKYGVPLSMTSSNVDFAKTQINAPLTITVGMSFGKFK